MGFSRQYWSGWPFPPLGDLPDPGIKPMSLASPALAGGFFSTSATWEALGTGVSQKQACVSLQGLQAAGFLLRGSLEIRLSRKGNSPDIQSESIKAKL